MTIRSELAMATGFPANGVERALAAAVRDSARIGELLDELRQGRLWVPLPDDGSPVTDGHALTLPTVRYLDAEFVPAFTSAGQLDQAVGPSEPFWAAVPSPRASAPPAAQAEDPAVPSPRASAPPAAQAGGYGGASPRISAPPAAQAGGYGGASPRINTVPHAVVPAAELARYLPAGLGIALNPGAPVSVPIYPQDVAHIASAQADIGDTRIHVGHPPREPSRLLDTIALGLWAVPSARSATRVWLRVGSGQGLVVNVTLDDPADDAAQQAVLAAVEEAVVIAGPQFPVDVAFPGECEPGPLEHWAAANARPFYLRS